MKAIIFEITMLVLVTGFLIFLALDDRKNQRIRAEEDRQKALEEQRRRQQAGEQAAEDENKDEER